MASPDLSNLSSDHCTYKIVTGTSLSELAKNINDIIAQGWNADNFIGGVFKDDSSFCQAVYFCPENVEDDK